MRRGLLILALGLAAGVLAYYGVYRFGTRTPRALLRSSQPELAWLQHEFNLGEAEFARISQLHSGYLPLCLERCRRIEELNTALSTALDRATNVTTEIDRLLSERTSLRATCQAEMLKHFFDVSRSMPPEQGRRYLAWVRENTCLQEQTMHHSGGGHRAPAASLNRP
jgi:hypothetical protein